MKDKWVMNAGGKGGTCTIILTHMSLEKPRH